MIKVGTVVRHVSGSTPFTIIEMDSQNTTISWISANGQHKTKTYIKDNVENFIENGIWIVQGFNECAKPIVKGVCTCDLRTVLNICGCKCEAGKASLLQEFPERAVAHWRR